MNKSLIIFLESLNPSFIDTFGQPNIQFYSDYYEVSFGVVNTIRNLDLVSLQHLVSLADEFRMFGAPTDKIMVCFTFWRDKD